MPAFALTTPAALQPAAARPTAAHSRAVPINRVLRSNRTPMQLSLFGAPPTSR